MRSEWNKSGLLSTDSEERPMLTHRIERGGVLLTREIGTTHCETMFVYREEKASKETAGGSRFPAGQSEEQGVTIWCEPLSEVYVSPDSTSRMSGLCR